MKILKTITASIGISLFFFCMGCGIVAIPEATPGISQILPQTIMAGSKSVTMKIVGSNFTSQAVVLWNGSSLATSVVDSNTLAATVASNNLATPAVAHLQVQNVETGRESSPVNVTVASPAATTSSSPTVTRVVPLVISTTSLPSGIAGGTYSASLAATGGTPGYTWSVKAGKLPTGLSLGASNGIISGKPTSSGTFTFSVAVSDSSASSNSPAQTATATFAMLVSAQSISPLVITSSRLPGGTAAQAYGSLLSAGGGTAPYTWSITSGQLPAGLSLVPSTGVISGTPRASGTSDFTVKVTDSSKPAQTASVSVSIVVGVAGASPLTITTTSLFSGNEGTVYSATLQANGGTPAYTWSISSGSLPAGLTMAATTGVISGTPTATGTSRFTATVSDNGKPVQTKSIATSITVASAQPTGPGTTWFVRPDGGTRYSANMTAGQCDGQSDAPYPGMGTNQHCAFNDFRYMWDDDSGDVGAGKWVIAGGDTVVIRGCKANAHQMNASNPNCRIGWDINTGGGSANEWCTNVGSYTCYNPPIPAGTAAQPTRILGGCAYGTYTCTPINSNYPYGITNETQLFGGMGLTWTFNLQSTQYVDIEGIELTTHNGVCTRGTGAPAYPRGCSGSSPLDDYAQNGFLTNNTSANLTFQDVYVHGFDSAGFSGPIGGPITMTRVFSGFNAFAGWNFDDGSDTADAAGSSITASYVTMMGNGCYEQYPIVNTRFPARACYDTNSAGFGDAWSGQDTELDAFTCDHCVMQYNTKDAFIGPHTQIANLTITHSVSIGNMGAQMKWGAAIGSNVLFQDNLIVHNCIRMSDTLPGAEQNFNKSTGLGGSYLTGWCRAGGNGLAALTRSGSTNRFIGNTIISAAATVVDYNCGYYTVGNVFNQETNCSTSPLVWMNNNIIGYNDPSVGAAPGLWYLDPGARGSLVVTSSYNNEYGIRLGDKCGVNHIACSDPLLLNEPSQMWINETALDAFNPFVTGNSFYPTPGSPLIGAGTPVSGWTADYYGATQPNPPAIGAIEP